MTETEKLIKFLDMEIEWKQRSAPKIRQGLKDAIAMLTKIKRIVSEVGSRTPDDDLVEKLLSLTYRCVREKKYKTMHDEIRIRKEIERLLQTRQSGKLTVTRKEIEAFADTINNIKYELQNGVVVPMNDRRIEIAGFLKSIGIEVGE